MRVRARRQRRAPRSSAARIGGAAVAMVLVAEGAVWLLAPRAEVPAPLPVAEGELLSPAQLDAAHSFRDGQRWLGLAVLGAQGAVLLAVALGHPAGASRRLVLAGQRRPLAAAALAGGGIALATSVAALPPSLFAHERAVDAGVSIQPLASWLWDSGREAAINAVFVAGGAALLLALVRRSPRSWWAAGSVAVVGLAVVFTWVAPVVLAPIFNRFEPLPEGSAPRGEVLALAGEAGIEVGEVVSVDASRRVTSLNAYVDGLGSTKRVVLYDNLVGEADRPELRSVVAHELGHVAGEDIPRGIAYVALVAPLGLVFSAELARSLARRRGLEPTSAASVPAYLFALSLAALVLGLPGSQLSRKVEARADAYALELTGDPQALIDLQLRLARENLSDPDPPALPHALLGTHPRTVERVGAALAYAERRGLETRLPR